MRMMNLLLIDGQKTYSLNLTSAWKKLLPH